MSHASGKTAPTQWLWYGLAIVVAPLFHSRRSALSYRRFFALLGIRLISQPFESGLQVSNWWRTKDGWLLVAQESTELLYYRVFVL